MRYVRVLLLCAIAALGCAGSAAATVFVSPSGHRLSLTLRHGVSTASVRGLQAAQTPAARGSRQTAAGGLLAYHGGPVLHSEKPYLVYWEPGGTHTLTADNRTVMDTYLSDVAAASGHDANVYGVLPQYGDATGSAAYLQTFASGSQAIIDTQPYPAAGGGCQLGAGLTACVTDGQLQAEVTRLIGASGGTLPTGTGTGAPIYFVVTPQDVNVCLSGGACASNNFCAYHGDFLDGGSPVLYAAMPFAIWAGGSTKACQDDGTTLYQTPDTTYHGNHAYIVADNLSHELSETITDPLLNAWYTKGNGSEVGDLCEAYAPTSNPSKDVSANAYKPILAGTAAAGDLVDQFFNRHYYYNQTEWSNAVNDCRAT